MIPSYLFHHDRVRFLDIREDRGGHILLFLIHITPYNHFSRPIDQFFNTPANEMRKGFNFILYYKSRFQIYVKPLNALEMSFIDDSAVVLGLGWIAVIFIYGLFTLLHQFLLKIEKEISSNEYIVYVKKIKVKKNPCIDKSYDVPLFSSHVYPNMKCYSNIFFLILMKFFLHKHCLHVNFVENK